MDSKYINSICDELGQAEIKYDLADSIISIPLPREFGVIEVREYEQGKDVIQLLDSLWATHGYLLMDEYHTSTPEASISRFIKDIYSGRLKMVVATDEYGDSYHAIWNTNEIKSANNEEDTYKIC